MRRYGWIGLFAPLAILLPNLAAEPAPPSGLETTLEVQITLATARAYITHHQPKLAVDELEKNLAKANGHSQYLELLRDSYRAYVKQLILSNQADVAQRYVQRLVILDPNAVSDPSLKPGDGPKFEPVAQTPPRNDKKGPPLPDFMATLEPRTKLVPAKAPTVRAIRELPQDDPFDVANRRLSVSASPKDGDNRVTQLLTQANQEFDRAHYADAQHFYEQVVQLDRGSLDTFKDRLAYCMMDSVVQKLNASSPAAKMDELKQQVRSAMSMSQRLEKHGAWLLTQIDQRNRAAEVVADPQLNLQHFSRNPQGWLVTETTNFRIFHNQERELVERVALIAERTRASMSRKWFGSEPSAWSPKCEIVLHATASDYSRLTNVPASSPGHSRIETDPVTFRVIGRRVDLHLDTVGVLEAILPHETTHVVLAGNFGQHQVPRWADEGIAVLTEPLEKVEQHRRNLAKAHREGLLFPVQDLMNLQNYPDPRQIAAFYAESVMLVEFLTTQRGPEVTTAFIRDGLGQGYESALRKHFGWSFRDLQSAWERQVLGETQKLAAGR
jgi:hypothetical protein